MAVSEFDGPDGREERRVHDYQLVAYDTPHGNVAAYYPETNPLIPLGSVARKIQHPGVPRRSWSDSNQSAPPLVEHRRRQRPAG